VPRPPRRSSQWTLGRIADTIWRTTGVCHHPAQVWRLPAYAPELNPVETLWANPKGKGSELANFASDTLDEVIAAATGAADRVRQPSHLPYWFLRRCDLSLW